MAIKLQLLLISACFFTAPSFAQTHNNFWFRTTLEIPATAKLKADVEYQHRRQNDFGAHNPMEKTLLQSVRTWLIYKAGKDVTLSVSPFAYFSHHRIIQKETDAPADATHETRFSAAVEFQQQLARNFLISNRTAVEYRAFTSADDVTRWRDKIWLRYDFKEDFNMSVGDEILLNSSGTDHQHIFDHNRLFVNSCWNITPTFKIDWGYIYISRLAKSNVEVLQENNLYVNLTYILAAHSKHK